MLFLLLLVDFAEAKKPKKTVAPPVGWHREEGWAGDCYYPPDFSKMPEGDRKMARQKALEEMKAQWSGARDDGVTIDPGLIEEVEIVLLGRPVLIERVAPENLAQCQALRKGGNISAWQGYLGGLPRTLTVGECNQPLTYTMFDYLDIGNAWQRPIHLCKGDRARITATVQDRYRIRDDGDWITVAGEPGTMATSTDYPCNMEGCLVGMLVGKFVTDAGVEMVFPIGAEKVFEAPEHGTLSYAINDNVWYDNKWFKTATIEDRTAVTIEPAP